MSSTLYNWLHDFTVLSNSMKLEDSTIVKFEVSKEFCENKARINSIDFSQDGRTLISSSDDDTIILYDCERGIKKRDIMSKKYGVDMIKYTHATNAAIHTSTKENDIIRYLSLHDNKYLRYFNGHDKRVVTLCMSPADDTFISGSLDHTVKVWDLRLDKFQGALDTKEGPPTANFDPEGLIFAIGTGTEFIRLYDVRLYTKGPFNTIRLPNPPPNVRWKSLKFSPNGKQILVTTDHEELHIFDAFSGAPLHHLSVGPKVTAPVENPCEAAYSPDSQYILYGSIDGCIHVWSANKGVKVTVLKPPRNPPDPVQCVMFNPKFMLLASACSKMSFWIPVLDEHWQ